MTTAAASTAQAGAWQAGLRPPVERVRPGIWSIPVPLPTAALRYVLVYAFELPDGIGIVDVGWDNDEAWAALRRGVASIGYALRDIGWILVTHVHRDHYGLAARLQQHAGSRVAMHPLEAQTLLSRHGSAAAQRQAYLDWMAACGVPVEEAGPMLPGSLAGSEPIPLPEPDLLLDDGDVAPFAGWDLRAFWTPGHTPGHLCFREPRHQLFLSGDHVLPHITPNISFSPRQPPDPLGDYRRSLARCEGLVVEEVLPAHEYRFTGLADRVLSLKRHHDERLEHMLAQVRKHNGSTSWQLSERGDWSRPWASISPQTRRLALGETESHLATLSALRRVTARRDNDVIRWWSPDCARRKDAYGHD